MAIHSRLVVVETVLPEKGVSHALAVLDLSMMAFGGLDRTFSGWNSLLERAGMKVERIILLEGTSRILNYAVFEAVRI
ncbi:MAG: hypothetical protein M1820_007114 [Bogoriella megaspora]|nr:MAG: hypothetical protein M1820_007114 [Bogoriella megaspora]